MMSVPMATCTVTGMFSRAAAASTLSGANGGFALTERQSRPPARCPCPRATPAVIASLSSLPGLFGHAEAPGPERLVHVL